MVDKSHEIIIYTTLCFLIQLELKVRLLEGKVQEETLKIQQQHDLMVKKVMKFNLVLDIDKQSVENRSVSDITLESRIFVLRGII